MRLAGTGAVAGALAAAGKQRRKVVPLPSAVSMLMPPPDWVTMPYTVDKPRPVPLSFGLVVKNGSKRWAATPSLMPVPVSATVSLAYRPGVVPGWAAV